MYSSKLTAAATVTFLVSLLCEVIKGENILFVFTGGTYSHEIAIGPLVKSLADKGHKVSFLSSYTKKPFTHPSVEIIAPKTLVDNMENNWKDEKIALRLAYKEKAIWYQFPDWAIGICKILLDSPADQGLANLFYTNRTFDLVILDAAINDCGFIIAHYFNAKVIVSDSTTLLPWHYDIYGLPVEASWIPVMSSHFNYPMTFKNRLENYLESFVWTYLRYFYLYPEMESIMRKFLKKADVPSFIDLERNVSLVLLNSHPSVDLPRSLPPLFVNIGGMQCWDTENADTSHDIQTFLDEANNGAILIVFGTTVNLASIPQQTVLEFFQAIEHLKDLRFIWKWLGPTPANVPKNLMMVPWLPQKAILGHRNIKAFITHCGLNSVMEATFYAVPVVGIPIFGDQDLIAYTIQAHEIGTRVEVREISVETLTAAISSVLNMKKYKENMQKMSRAFRDRPQTPVETAVYWVEYVLRMEDTSFLRPMNLSNSLFQRHSLDVLFFLFALLLLGVTFIVYIALLMKKCIKRYIVCQFCSSKDRSDKKYK